AGELGDLHAVAEGRAHAGHLVRGDLLAVAGAADDQPEAARVVDDAGRGGQAVRRVVVVGVVGVWADVDRLVAGPGQPGDEVGLEVEAGVVGAEVYAHGQSVAPPATGGPAAVTPPPGSGRTPG